MATADVGDPRWRRFRQPQQPRPGLLLRRRHLHRGQEVGRPQLARRGKAEQVGRNGHPQVPAQIARSSTKCDFPRFWLYQVEKVTASTLGQDCAEFAVFGHVGAGEKGQPASDGHVRLRLPQHARDCRVWGEDGRHPRMLGRATSASSGHVHLGQHWGCRILRSEN